MVRAQQFQGGTETQSHALELAEVRVAAHDLLSDPEYFLTLSDIQWIAVTQSSCLLFTHNVSFFDYT
jgi:hypothetical protein